MKKYSVRDLQQEILHLQGLLEKENDEDKQIDLECEIEILQGELKRLIAKEQENER